MPRHKKMNAPEAPGSIKIGPCTEKDLQDLCPYQIDAEGWDGQGNMRIGIYLTQTELDAFFAYIDAYRAWLAMQRG